MATIAHASPPAADPLRAFLSGKRLAPRVELDLPVEIVVGDLRLAARAVDASEGGALLALSGPSLLDAGLDGGMALMALHERLGAGFELQMPLAGFGRRAHPVRIATRTGDEDNLYVGCRFESPLTVLEQQRLGLLGDVEVRCMPEAQDGAQLAALPLVVAPDHPVHVLARGAGDAILGPRFAGRLLGMGGSALALELHLPRERGIFEILGRDELTCELRDAGGVLWTVAARPTGVRLGGHPAGRVEIGLLVRATPPLALRRCLVPRPA